MLFVNRSNDPVFQVKATQYFERDLKAIRKRHPSLIREDLPELIRKIEEDPYQFVKLIGFPVDLRKARCAVRSARIGKSGGYRLIFQVEPDIALVYLLAIYYKPDDAVLSPLEIARRILGTER